MDTSKNILIIRPDMIGDSMLITPALALLKQKDPNCKITVLCSPYTAELFKNIPIIDDIIEDAGFFELVNIVREKRFDLSVHFYNEMKYAAVALFAGIKQRLGDSSKPLLSPFYTLRNDMEWNNLTLHEVEHNILLLKPLGIGLPDNPPPMQITASDSLRREFERIHNIMPSDFVVGIHIGTGRGNKAWLPDRYAKVINYLTEQHNAIVFLTGSKKEASAAKEILKLCDKKPINLVEKTTIKELIAVISRYNMFIGVDTGPMHIAAALKIPIVAISPTKFTKPTEWGSWQTQNVVVRKAAKCKQKCSPQTCPFDDCLKEITADDVIEGIEGLLGKRGNKNLQESKADWFKKSVNIYTNREEIIRELTFAGYHAVDIGIVDSIFRLADQMVKEDINVIHWVGQSRPMALSVARAIATPSLPIRPLLIYENSRTVVNANELIRFYRDQFNPHPLNPLSQRERGNNSSGI